MSVTSVKINEYLYLVEALLVSNPRFSLILLAVDIRFIISHYECNHKLH